MSTHPDDLDREEREALAGLERQLDAIRERHRSDPPLDLLRAARADALPSGLQEAVGQHLSESDWSRTLVDGLDHEEPPLEPHAERRLLARIDEALARERDVAGFRTWFRIALVSSLVGVASLAIWFLVLGPEQTRVPIFRPPAATTAPASPEPPPRLAFDKPEVRLSISALTWRGGPGDNPLLADLKPGLDAYRAGDYATADRELAALTATYPDAVEVHFYQGMARLFLNDAPGAAASLAAAEPLADETFASDVRWYRAVAEQHAGNAVEARSRLESLCAADGDRRACDALERLTSRSSRPD